MKGHWQKVFPRDYGFPFFTAKVKQALDHQLYSSALKETGKNPAPPVRSQSPQRYNTRVCLISMTAAAHSYSPNSIDWCRTPSNTPSTCPKDFSTLTLSPNPQAALLCSLSNANNPSCFQLFVSILAIKAEWCFVASNQGLSCSGDG